MNKRIITPEQQKILRNNQYVAKCSAKSITFTAEFKKYATKAYKEGKCGQEIFINAGIPLDIVGREAPKNCMRLWLKKSDGELEKDGRGKHGKSGRKRMEREDLSRMTEKEKIEYLTLYCEYMNAENDFLAKTRGIKRIPFVYRPGKDTS